jgi:hypothetical protein
LISTQPLIFVSHLLERAESTAQQQTDANVALHCTIFLFACWNLSTTSSTIFRRSIRCRQFSFAFHRRYCPGIAEHLGQSISAIAKHHGRCRTRLGKLIELSCLAHDIITAIVNGKQPAPLDSKALTAATIPLDWAGQRKLLGFCPNR